MTLATVHELPPVSDRITLTREDLEKHVSAAEAGERKRYQDALSLLLGPHSVSAVERVQGLQEENARLRASLGALQEKCKDSKWAMEATIPCSLVLLECQKGLAPRIEGPTKL